MGFFSKLFGRKQSEPQKPEHAVIVNFSYGQTDLQPVFQLEDQLAAAIAQADVGEYDGHEVAVDGSHGILYMYGPDGDKLFSVVKPVLESSGFMKGASVVIRYGPPEDGVRETQIKLSI